MLHYLYVSHLALTRYEFSSKNWSRKSSEYYFIPQNKVTQGVAWTMSLVAWIVGSPTNSRRTSETPTSWSDLLEGQEGGTCGDHYLMPNAMFYFRDSVASFLKEDERTRMLQEVGFQKCKDICFPSPPPPLPFPTALRASISAEPQCLFFPYLLLLPTGHPLCAACWMEDTGRPSLHGALLCCAH